MELQAALIKHHNHPIRSSNKIFIILIQWLNMQCIKTSGMPWHVTSKRLWE